MNRYLGDTLMCTQMMYWWLLIAAIFVLYIAYKLYEYQKGKELLDKISNRHVFITGCDSGFGKELARSLDRQGVPVIAGCLTEKGSAELKRQASSRLRIVPLDVTDQNSIRNAVESVKRILPEPTSLWGLVNNAGIQVLHAPLEFHSPEAIQKCLSVNLLGAIEVTKAFLPFVRKSRGRLVYVSSACGFQSFPCRVPYVISKVGLEALSECLRRELYDVGVSCHTIQPGSFKTNIIDPEEMRYTLQKSFDAADSEVQGFYGQHWLEKMKLTFYDFIKEQNSDLSPVTDNIQHALFSLMPKRSYRPGPFCRFWYGMSLLPDWVNTWYFAMSPPDAVSQPQKSI